jgi:predicted ATP-grasp superfamily ATP-dependent carboligase
MLSSHYATDDGRAGKGAGRTPTAKIGCFHLYEPLPQLNGPYVLAGLHPWIDVNGVGSLVLDEVAARLGASELGVLSKPGEFYDFTRYRPTVRIDGDGIHDLSIPTTRIHYAKREGRNDIIVLRMLEPHARSEVYIASVLKLLKTFKARKYILLGSMHDMVPHTRPLLVSGYGMGAGGREDAKKAGALPITRHGPSSIMNLITKKAASAGIDAVSLIVSLPQYVVVEEDYQGEVRLLEALNMLYDIPIDNADFERAMEQRRLIDEKVDEMQVVKGLLPQLESSYDLRVQAAGTEGTSPIASGMEDIFWRMMGKDIGKA